MFIPRWLLISLMESKRDLEKRVKKIEKQLKQYEKMRTINEIRIRNGLMPIDDPMADCYFKESKE